MTLDSLRVWNFISRPNWACIRRPKAPEEGRDDINWMRVRQISESKNLQNLSSVLRLAGHDDRWWWGMRYLDFFVSILTILLWLPAHMFLVGMSRQAFVYAYTCMHTLPYTARSCMDVWMSKSGNFGRIEILKKSFWFTSCKKQIAALIETVKFRKGRVWSS